MYVPSKMYVPCSMFHLKYCVDSIFGGRDKVNASAGDDTGNLKCRGIVD